MDEDQRTVWCGNLSDQVTEDVLYELFLQSGPVQKVSIPKDRDGKQRTYGFVTFKHAISVPYALDLFDGTGLFNRVLSMKTRNNIEPVPNAYSNNMLRSDNIQAMNNTYGMREPVMVGNFNPLLSLCGLLPRPDIAMYQNQMQPRVNHNDQRSSRSHPYQREWEQHRNDYRDNHRDRHTSHRSNENSRSSESRHHRRNHR